MFEWNRKCPIAPKIFVIYGNSLFFKGSRSSMAEPKHIAAILVAAAVIIITAIFAAGYLNPVHTQSSLEAVSKGYGGFSSVGAVPAPASAPVQRMAADQVSAAGNADQGIQTKIIKTGQISLEVPSVPAAIGQVGEIAVQNGGYVSSSNVYTQENNRRTGYVEIRVPADKFETVMQSLAPLGKVLSTSVQRSDVTEQYVDLTIQNESYHTQLDNYYRLMDKATSVEDIIKIQAQIDQITLALNRIEGQLRYLNSQIDLSTITVNLQEPQPVGGETGYSIVDAINAGIGAFYGMISAIILLVFALVPLIIIGVIVYAIYRYYKKRKGGSATTAAPATAPTEAKV